MMAITRLKAKSKITAVVTRADGKRIDLGRIDGPFPWRAWLYRLAFAVNQRRGA